MRDWWYGVYTDERDDPDVELIPIGWRKAEQYGITGPFPQPGPLATPEPAPAVEEEEEVAYLDLGPYSFTTAGDTTGLNAGNLTSILDTSTLKMAKFEMYRLVLGTSNIEPVPAVIQTAEATVGNASSLTVNFANPTTLGNAIIVVIVLSGAGSVGITGVTINSQADNFALVASSTEIGDQYVVTIWADPDSVYAGTQLVISNNSTALMSAWAYEVSGLLKTTSVATLTDTAQIGVGSSSLLTASGLTTRSNDFVVGVGQVESAPLVLALNAGIQPATGWTSLAQQQQSTINTAISSYNVVPDAETTVKYGISWSGADDASASYAAFFSVSTTLPPALPFTVKVDSFTWDVNQTVSGVGFTYDVNKPMYLNQGQRLAILWTNLATAQYKSVENNLNVTAWFRYDPAIPANAAILGS